MIFLLKCPKCGNQMKYQAQDNNPLSKKRKACVYCGHNFGVSFSIVRKL
jgi:Zn ribbon nucleic-acid-binding protein